MVVGIGELVILMCCEGLLTGSEALALINATHQASCPHETEKLSKPRVSGCIGSGIELG